jgi:hypothetical protein
MAAQYRCGSERRRRLVRESATLNGIDYLVVEPDQATIQVHFLHDLPGTGPGAVPAAPAAGLSAENVAVDGGTRITPIAVSSVASAGKVLTVTVDRPGDFSEYRLAIVEDDPERTIPDGFDPQLSSIRFTFKVDCPTGFDCRSDEACPEDVLEEPELDYLAKDYASFRRLMLDRMAALAPDWRERNPADIEVALVELLAYVGDHLSYFQDAVATEAYLGTARRRDSVRRHARLLDYRMHDGCNARTWIQFVVNGAAVPVPEETVVVGRSGSKEQATILSAADLERLLARETPPVFETRAAIVARSAHNEIPLHAWSEIGCCLPAGATRATLRNDAGLLLGPGDWLLFEELRGATGEPADADPEHRQVVRLVQVRDRKRPGDPPGSLRDELDGTPIMEVEWDPRDALTFPLCLSAVADDGTTVFTDLSVARGNLVLADHGQTVPVALDPPAAPVGRPYRPMLELGPAASAESVDPVAPASIALDQDPRRALQQIELIGDGAAWSPQPDLLGSDPFATEFVAETDDAGIARIRFGDGALGRRPTDGSRFSASARIGNGAAGNVGPDTLTHVVWSGSDILAVRNPLPARGGTDAELAEEVRLIAPHAFRRQERAVTEADYAAIAGRRSDVGHAAGRIRWSGSWYTAVVTADRPGGEPVDAPFIESVVGDLDLYRMAGVDLAVDRPIDVALDIELVVCARAEYLASEVRRRVLDALSRRRFPSGERGLFHPDNWTFGQPIYLSQLYRAVLRVDGISWVDARRFQRFGKAPNRELEDGVLRAAPREILRLDNDPNFRERGRLAIEMRGGR